MKRMLTVPIAVHSRGELPDYVKYLRRVWFDLQAKTLRDFARRMRATVDQVNPDLRMGFCADYTFWNFEGICAIELTLTQREWAEGSGV